MLSDSQIRSAKPQQKPYKLPDDRGLFLLVQPSGRCLWRLRCTFQRKDKLVALGQYPDVSLKVARERRDEARRWMADGVDPVEKRRSERSSPVDSFEAVASELFAILRKATLAGEDPPAAASEVVQRTIQPGRKRNKRRREPISADTIDTMERRLTTHVFPYVGSRDVKLLESQDLLRVLRRIEERGTYELAHRVRSICSRVLRYGRATGRKCQDVAADLGDLLTPVQSQNMAAIIEPARIGDLLRSIDVYHGDPVTRLALKLAPLIFPRPIELRNMLWSQLTLEGETPEWRVPWRRMKMRDPHIVPLSRQAVSILKELKCITGDEPFVFPNGRRTSRSRPMSENCLTSALRAMGYGGEEMSWHGFRATASTVLNELGWNEAWIEMQLAHQERRKSKKAYNHAKYLPQRRLMMQALADYYDQLRAQNSRANLSQIDSDARNRAMAADRVPKPIELLTADSGGGRSASGSSYVPGECLARAKKNALAYVERGDLLGALGCLAADFQRSGDTAHSTLAEVGIKMFLSGSLASTEGVTNFINALR